MIKYYNQPYLLELVWTQQMLQHILTDDSEQLPPFVQDCKHQVIIDSNTLLITQILFCKKWRKLSISSVSNCFSSPHRLISSQLRIICCFVLSGIIPSFCWRESSQKVEERPVTNSNEMSDSLFTITIKYFSYCGLIFCCFFWNQGGQSFRYFLSIYISKINNHSIIITSNTKYLHILPSNE